MWREIVSISLSRWLRISSMNGCKGLGHEEPLRRCLIKDLQIRHSRARRRSHQVEQIGRLS
jgi:hypothetical protein